MNLKMIVSIVAVSAVLLAGTNLKADTVILQDGLTVFGSTYDGTEDTYNLLTGNADNNYGASGGLRVDGTFTDREGTSLIRFDLSGLKDVAGLEITGATLALRAFDNHNGRDNHIQLYEIKSANKDWVEGSSDDAIETGASCWNYEQYNTSSWAGGTNGCSVVGTDCGSNYLYNKVITTTSDTEYNWIITDADMLNTLEDWAKGTVDNAGMVLQNTGNTGTSTGYYSRTWFRSSDFVTAFKRPKLTITYTPEPATMTLLLLGLPFALRRRR